MPRDDEPIRVWLVERTFAEDKPNLLEHVYATPDGERYVRNERAMPAYVEEPGSPAAVEIDAAKLLPVDDETDRRRYAAEVKQVAAARAPDDRI